MSAKDDATPEGRALALSLFLIKLRNYAWGADAPVVTREDAGIIATGLEELLDQRRLALDIVDVFQSWEWEQQQHAARERQRAAAADQRKADAKAKREKAADDILARGAPKA